MHRIDTPGHVNNKFQSGDPNANPPVYSTRGSPNWFNAVQEEICNAIIQAGLTLSASGLADSLTKYLQLTNAIGQSWATFSTAAAGGAITNIDNRNATVTRDSDGVYTVTWDKDYADDKYCVIATAGWIGSSSTPAHCTVTDVAAGSCKVRVFDNSGNPLQGLNLRINVRASGTVAET